MEENKEVPNPEVPEESATNNTEVAGASDTSLVFPPCDVKLFVGGFHSDVTEDILRQHFSQFGAVAEVKIMRDATSGKNRGFGFVTMAEPSSKAKILSEKEHNIGGRKASVRQYSEADFKESFTDGPILKRKIFVGGVNPALGHEALENYFGKYGSLEDATIMRYPDGRSRGFGFVVFRDESTCKQVLQQRNHLVTPRDKVEVKPCLSRGKSRPAGAPAMPESHYGSYGMAPMHLYGGGYGYPGSSSYNTYSSMYAAGYSYGPGYSMPAGAWSEYRDGNGNPATWTLYDNYGGYYGGWSNSTGQPYGGPTATGSARGVEVSYYDIGPSAGNSNSGVSTLSPLSGSASLGTVHPAYAPMRRGGVSSVIPPSSTVGAAPYIPGGRGRSGPY